MSETHVRYEQRGGAAHLFLDRPEVHNAFDETTIAELHEAVRRAGADDGARVIVLAGEGRSFCAGADINWMRRTASYGEAENLEDARRLADLLHAIDTAPKPTVALVHGAAYGGGAGLVATCDIAVASADVRFRFSEVRLGIVPATISPYVVAAIGLRQARRYMLTAETIDAARAREIGLVHEVVPAAELASAGEAIVAALLENGPHAMAAIKAALPDVAAGPYDAAVRERTAQLIAEVRASEEGREGLSAFLEKRDPSWRGGKGSA